MSLGHWQLKKRAVGIVVHRQNASMGQWQTHESHGTDWKISVITVVKTWSAIWSPFRETLWRGCLWADKVWHSFFLNWEGVAKEDAFIKARINKLFAKYIVKAREGLVNCRNNRILEQTCANYCPADGTPTRTNCSNLFTVAVIAQA
jgi:hypothetical protein